jgi:hypothetical protein
LPPDLSLANGDDDFDDFSGVCCAKMTWHGLGDRDFGAGHPAWATRTPTLPKIRLALKKSHAMEKFSRQ